MQDEDFMHRAIELAEKGRFSVRPNPLVGCVLVRDGKIIAEAADTIKVQSDTAASVDVVLSVLEQDV